MSHSRRLTEKEAERFLQASQAGDWLPLRNGRINAREWLWLDEFLELDEAAARILAGHRGRLTLDGLDFLSDAAADALSHYAGTLLELNGLLSLSDRAAGSLSKYHGDLSLNSITCLSELAAAALAQHQAHLHLDNLRALPDTPGHLKLLHKLAAQEDASTQSFTNLTTLSHSAAEVLADLPGGVHLNNLISLSPTIAEILARNKKGLLFMRLNSLPVAVAHALARCEGALFINMPGRALSDEVAQALAGHRGGSLVLLDLDSLSESAANCFANHVGLLDLDRLTNLSDNVARALSLHKGPLRMLGFADLPSSLAEILRPRLLIEDDD